MKWRLMYWMAAIALAGCLSSPTGLSAQTSLAFTNIRVLANKEVALALQFSNGPTYRISTSSDLLQWPNLLTFSGAGSTLTLTDSAAPYLSQRIYRAQQVTEPNPLTGDHLTTTNGDVVIHPINHATFVMSWQGKTIYNDPVGGAARFAPFPKPDLILISHAHSDHFSVSTLNSVTNTNTIIIASPVVYTNTSATDTTLPATLKNITTVLTNGASTNFIGLTIDAIPAYNISNSNHKQGEGGGYVLTIGGKRIYIAGDTEDVPAMRMLQNIDVAFLPMNRPFTMYVTNAASATREFRPRVIYPYHYQPSTPTTDLNMFKQLVGQDLGIEVRLRKWY